MQSDSECLPWISVPNDKRQQEQGFGTKHREWVALLNAAQTLKTPVTHVIVQPNTENSIAISILKIFAMQCPALRMSDLSFALFTSYHIFPY